MQIRIKKEIEIITDIPDNEALSFFGESPSDNDIIQWADNKDVLTRDEALQVANPESCINYEILKEIEIVDKPKKLIGIRDKYSKKWIDYIKEELDRSERCDDCTAVGDDYDWDMNCNCETCPFNKPIDSPSEDE